jgi:hypothetical protein
MKGKEAMIGRRNSINFHWPRKNNLKEGSYGWLFEFMMSYLS